ncbi:MAG: hypothetical protein N3F07_01140 [Candidatus Micrarchaeota archaeon]|nr:hypothetical protein [Candidatus Micrarchaeota archaeon]
MSFKQAFFLSLEASASLLLLAVASSASYLMVFETQKAPIYFLCTDAAIILAGWEEESIQQALQELSSKSSLCLKLSGDFGAFEEGCLMNAGKERFAVTFPLWLEGKAQKATLLCHEN